LRQNPAHASLPEMIPKSGDRFFGKGRAPVRIGRVEGVQG
jgi:hypothetical protein